MNVCVIIPAAGASREYHGAVGTIRQVLRSTVRVDWSQNLVTDGYHPFSATHGDDATRDKGLLLGANDYLTKPLSGSKLMDVLERLFPDLDL